MSLASSRLFRSALTAALFTACAADVGPPGYQDAAREARANMISMDGRRYRRHIQRHIQSAFEDLIDRCYRETLDNRGAHLLLLINADGELVRFLIYPDGAFSSCISAGLDIPKLAPPPETNYWIKLFLETHPGV